MFIIDDSFEHEVWFERKKNSRHPRLVLLVDLWHPHFIEDFSIMPSLPSYTVDGKIVQIEGKAIERL